MSNSLVLLAALAGYLVGSLSFARIVSAMAGRGGRFPENAEARIEGSDSALRLDTVSATSVSLKGSPRLGFLTFVLDVLKVFVVVTVLKLLWPAQPYYLVAATTGVVGHVWPIYHRFNGGGGMSAIYGGLLVIDWTSIFVTAIGGLLLGLFVLRDLYLIYYAGLILLIPWLWFRTGSVAVVAYAVAVNLLFVVASYPAARRFYRLKKTDPSWRDPRVAWKLSAMGRGILKMLDKLGLGGKTDEPEVRQP
jgi:acyl phosphate:glycerol-3-phosphate acyltransferase